TEHVHGGRREFHGGVKKTTSSLENCVGEIENGKGMTGLQGRRLLVSCNQGKTTSTNFKEQEREEKRKNQQRVQDVEMGSITPLVFGTNGGMGADCNCFLKRLADKLSEKNEE
ncbi:unnamed protein product, partial [Porites lobata]